VYANLPLGCITIRTEFPGVLKGDPVTADRAAVELLMLNTEIDVDAEFATSRNFFAGSVAIESGEEPPVVTGEPVVRCKAPEVSLS